MTRKRRWPPEIVLVFFLSHRVPTGLSRFGEADMADIRMGVIGCGGRMRRMLLAEIAAAEGCVLSGGMVSPGSGYVGGDLGELAGIGRLGVVAGNAAGELLRGSDVVIEFTNGAATASHAA